ncbi:hypothetical protein [Arabiibacter massiliensis]|uniref:hypothetical protein n=1 Tax=Arabiibacter massiliensis TaxID=1870985 RepID=UPI0009BBAC8D|nr:hypothetical protein [Arabiibacter massiliensis]
MKPSNLREYNDLMGRVELPGHVHDAVLREVRRTEEPRAAARPRRKRARMVAAGGCAVALAVAVTVGLNISGLLTSALEPAPENSTASAPAGGNFFALAAYAAENPEQEPGKTVELSLGAFHPSGAGGTQDQRIAAFNFDMACTGDNIASIVYELEGDGLYFEWYDGEQFLRAHGVYDDDDPAVEEGYTIEDSTTFSVDYDEQDLDERDIECRVLVPVTLEGDLLELEKHKYAIVDDYEEIEQLNNQSMPMLFAQAADKLAQSTFTMTATFEDGTKQTKKYTIAPVTDFEALYRDYWESKGAVSLPALFTITENVAA